MTKLNITRNPRLLTFILLFFTFGLAAVAIITAISLQNRSDVTPTDSSAATTNCKVLADNAAGDVSLCSDAWDFNESDPCSPGYMKVCDGPFPEILEYQDGKPVYKGGKEICEPVRCGGTCDDKTTAGPHYAPECNNPYWCEQKITPVTDTPVTITDTPVTTTPDTPKGSVRVEYKCVDGDPDSDDRFDLRVDIPNQFGQDLGTKSLTSEPGSTTIDEISDFPVDVNVTVTNTQGGIWVYEDGCTSGVGGKVGDGGFCTIEFKGCKDDDTTTDTPVTEITTTTDQPRANVDCQQLSVTPLNGDNATFNAGQLVPGNTYRLDVTTGTPSRLGTRYAVKIGSGPWSVIANTIGDGANKGINFNDHYQPTYVDFTVPADLPPNTTIDFAGANVFKVDPVGTLTTQPGTDVPDNDSNSNVLVCGSSSPGMVRTIDEGNPVTVIDPQTGGTFTNPHTYRIDEGRLNELRVSCTPSSGCSKTYTLAVDVPECTGLDYNPKTNVKQGDTVSVTVAGENASTYKVVYSGGETEVNSTGTFNITIPTDTSRDSFDMVGYVGTDTPTITSDDAACKASLTFIPDTDVDKTINTSESTLVNDDTPIVDSSSTVVYDVVVSNGGTQMLQNVYVEDTLSAYKNDGTSITPFGSITAATPLTSPGPNSTPLSLAVASQDATTVTWQKIDKFFPTEQYTGKVTADISDFNAADDPYLRNEVCIFVDNNGNASYDNGEFRKCSHVDVYTSQPDLTVRKVALTLDGDDAEVVEPGERFKYEITLTNTGTTDIDLSTVTVTDTFDENFIDTFDIFTDSAVPAGATLTGNQIVWAAGTLSGTLSAGGTFNLSFELAPKDSFFEGKEVCSETVQNTVQASTPGYKTPESPPEYITVYEPECSEDFVIDKEANPRTVPRNGTVTYTATVTNTGNRSGPILKIVDDYPDEFSYVPGSSSFIGPDGDEMQKEPADDGGNLTWEFTSEEAITLAPEESLTLIYQMTVSSLEGPEYDDMECPSGSFTNIIRLVNPPGGSDQETVTVTTLTCNGLNDNPALIAGLVGATGVVFMGGYVLSRRRFGLKFQGNSGRFKPPKGIDNLTKVVEQLKRGSTSRRKK
ncbi:MAG: hypothetical protein ACOCXT_04285 [Candidatus Dojkabacteria bacterium]